MPKPPGLFFCETKGAMYKEQSTSWKVRCAPKYIEVWADNCASEQLWFHAKYQLNLITYGSNSITPPKLTTQVDQKQEINSMLYLWKVDSPINSALTAVRDKHQDIQGAQVTLF